MALSASRETRSVLLRIVRDRLDLCACDVNRPCALCRESMDVLAKATEPAEGEA